MTYLLIVAAVVVVLAVLAGLRRGKAEVSPNADAALPYRRKDYLLTKAERAFYEVLRRTVGPEWTVLAKVRLLDLVWLPRGTPNPQAWRNRVQSKHADFVLCRTETMSPELVIELDDASHERADRRARDAFVDRVLEAAGLPVLHVPAREGYVQRELAERIEGLITSQGIETADGRR